MTTPQPPRRQRSSNLTLSRLTDVVDHFGEAFVLWDADDRSAGGGTAVTIWLPRRSDPQPTAREAAA